MKKGILLLTSVFIVIVSIAWAVLPKQANTSLTRWEYKYVAVQELLPKEEIETDDDEKAEEALNALGHEGWELFQVGNKGFYFKRPTN